MPAHANLDAVVGDVRTLASEVRSLVETIAANGVGSTSTVIHKTDSSGFMVALCVACVMIMLGFVLFENRSFGSMQRAVEANRSDIAKLRADIDKIPVEKK